MKKLFKIINKDFRRKISMTKDFVYAAIKLGVGIYSFSFFMIINGLFSICIGWAKKIYFKGINDNEKNPLIYFKNIALLIFFGGVIYTIYMTRLFFHPMKSNYTNITAISIATISFLELGFAIAGLVKSNTILETALRCINLSSSFTAIVTTQIAILAFTSYADSSKPNGLLGIIFGSFIILTSLFMFVYYFKKKKYIKSKIDKIKVSSNAKI